MKLSASGANLLKDCPRAFYFKYKLKLPADWQPPWFDFGVKLHKVLETGEKCDSEEINRLANVYKETFIEADTKFKSFSEVWFENDIVCGAVDIVIADEETKTAILVDIKTASTYKKRTLDDYQANLYVQNWPLIQEKTGLQDYTLTHFEWRELNKKTFKTKVTRYTVEEFTGVNHQIYCDYGDAICALEEPPEFIECKNCYFCLWRETCAKVP